MDKIRNIKNRLSLSVDKLSATRHSRSPPVERKSCHLVSSPLSERNIPTSVSPSPQRPKRDRSRASKGSRHSSIVLSSSVEDFCVESKTVYMDRAKTHVEANAVQCAFDIDHPGSPDESFDSFQGFSKVLANNDPDSLIDEVMKEVDKISNITDGLVKNMNSNKEKNIFENTSLSGKTPVGKTSSLEKPPSGASSQRSSRYDNMVMSQSQDTLNINTSTSSNTSLVQDKLRSSGQAVDSTCTTISTASTLHAESLTSGYFSDSASEDVSNSESKKRHDRSKTASPIQRIFKLSKLEKNDDERFKTAISVSPNEISEKKEVPKKESIYSRLIKSAKRDGSTARAPKEPIYARIKPKLKLDTNFKPIDPSATKESGFKHIDPSSPKESSFKHIDPSSPKESTSSQLIKPEPIYSKVKAKELTGPVPNAISQPPTSTSVSILSGSHTSSFTPIIAPSEVKEQLKEPIYSSIKPKKEKSRTLPLESLYSRISRKKDSNTLPKDIMAPPPPPPKTKEPIYNQPLPALPSEYEHSVKSAKSCESAYSSGSDSCYGKVTVKAKEISPSKPSVITICNPGYAKTKSSSDPIASSSPPGSPVSTAKAPPTAVSSNTGPLFSVDSTVRTPEEEFKTIMESSTTSLDPGSAETLDASQSNVSLEHELQMDFGKSSKLSRLVEELTQELETVSKRVENSDLGDVSSTREVLSRLLSNYDVPKNLRRVEEADEADIQLAEKVLLQSSASGDELRYMDDDENMETVYADVPDYSQDEFVIALDDENDPKYASLTSAMRRKHRGGDSPGKVSRKSAQVYVNVINVISALKVLINSNSTKAATVINRMGTLARPYAHKVHTSINDTSWVQRKLHHKSGHNGFDELRRYIKSGGEFCKELAIIMHERAELEATYAKGLHKLSTKLVKASREAMGTVSEAWQAVGAELEHEGDIHRILATSLTEEVVRPLRQLIETQHKIRKGVEGMVDKTTKNLNDWRSAESKAKKTCYHNTKENEKVQDMMLEARLGRGKALSEKDMVKLEKNRRKAEEAVQKSDLEYYSFCVRSERARQEWESAVYKGSNCFQTLEEERLAYLKELVIKYHNNNKETAPKLVASAARLEEPVAACDVEKDIQAVIIAKGTGENIPEQSLPDFYSEDLNNSMNKVRRREALEKFVKLIRVDLDRERRGKQGVENLAKALQETPNFGGEESQQDVNDKLQNMKAMLAYLEAARYKVQSSLDEINNRPRTAHPLAKHIEIHRDKQGMPVSILKVPPWVRGNSTDVSPISESPQGSPNWTDRGTADGNSVQPDSDFDMRSSTTALINKRNSQDEHSLQNTESQFPSPSSVEKPCDALEPRVPRAFMYPARYPSLTLLPDEFSSQGSDHDYQSAVNEITSQVRSQTVVGTSQNVNIIPSSEDRLDSGTGSAPPDGTYYARPVAGTASPSDRCKALYDYEANMYDELSIRTGDIINIHNKQPDGWWVGELDGIVGIFPATYVEEID